MLIALIIGIYIAGAIVAAYICGLLCDPTTDGMDLASLILCWPIVLCMITIILAIIIPAAGVRVIFEKGRKHAYLRSNQRST